MKMTRMIALATALSLALLVGCSPKVEEETPTPETTTPPATVEPEVLPEEQDDDTVTPELDSDELPVAPLPEEEETPAPSGDIVLSNTDFTLFSEGESYKITLSNLLDSDTVTFASSDEAVATVSEDGTVTAVAAGTATITATILVDGITAIERTAIVRCNIKEEVASVDISTFFTKVQSDFVSTSVITPLEGEMLTGAYPGLSEIDTLQCAVYAPMMSFSAMELALVEVSDPADINAVKAVFQARIDAQVAGGAWYPAAIEGWQNQSHIVTSGNYVLMVVTSGYQETLEDPITETAEEFIAIFNNMF